MPKLTLDISMSLDGFIAGPNPSLEDPLGEGGEGPWEHDPKADGWWADLCGYPHKSAYADSRVMPRPSRDSPYPRLDRGRDST